MQTRAIQFLTQCCSCNLGYTLQHLCKLHAAERVTVCIVHIEGYMEASKGSSVPQICQCTLLPIFERSAYIFNVQHSSQLKVGFPP